MLEEPDAPVCYLCMRPYEHDRVTGRYRTLRMYMSDEEALEAVTSSCHIEHDDDVSVVSIDEHLRFHTLPPVHDELGCPLCRVDMPDMVTMGRYVGRRIQEIGDGAGGKRDVAHFIKKVHDVYTKKGIDLDPLRYPACSAYVFWEHFEQKT
jgi:hypothetical protein